MPVAKLTKTVVHAAKPAERSYELRDRLTPDFLCKIMPTARKGKDPSGERKASRRADH